MTTQANIRLTVSSEPKIFRYWYDDNFGKEHYEKGNSKKSNVFMYFVIHETKGKTIKPHLAKLSTGIFIDNIDNLSHDLKCRLSRLETQVRKIMSEFYGQKNETLYRVKKLIEVGFWQPL